VEVSLLQKQYPVSQDFMIAGCRSIYRQYFKNPQLKFPREISDILSLTYLRRQWQFVWFAQTGGCGHEFLFAAFLSSNFTVHTTFRAKNYYR
jgi:hypothetical protein